MTKARVNADNVTADIAGVTAGTGITGGGTSGTVTITNDMATTIAAKGDLLAGTANDAYSALTVGANGTVLTAASGETTGLSWAAPAAGSMTLLSTTSLSGTSVTISSIDQTYNHLQIYIEDWQSSDNGGVGFLRVNSNTTSPNYRYHGIIGDKNGSTSTSGSYGTQIVTGPQTVTNGDQNNTIVYDIYFYTSAVKKVGNLYSYYSSDGTQGTVALYQAIFINETSAINSITLLSNATQAGTVKIYGVK